MQVYCTVRINRYLFIYNFYFIANYYNQRAQTNKFTIMIILCNTKSHSSDNCIIRQRKKIVMHKNSASCC